MIGKLKICGMKHNVPEVAALSPQYMGFIFYEKSPRYFEGKLSDISKDIQKVGVFVNASQETILEKTRNFGLDILQLHGDERVEYVNSLKSKLQQSGHTRIQIWKVFPVDDHIPFDSMIPYQNLVDAFLFDTKSKKRGGTGKSFNWDLLKDYPFTVPFVISGGIGPGHVLEIKKLFDASSLPILAIDVNSKFEIEPGRKDVATLKTFIDELSC